MAASVFPQKYVSVESSLKRSAAGQYHQFYFNSYFNKNLVREVNSQAGLNVFGNQRTFSRCFLTLSYQSNSIKSNHCFGVE